LLKLVCRAGILYRRDGRNGRALSAVPPGLDAQSNPIPALKRRAVFKLSLRDKLVCAMFILVSTPASPAMGKFHRPQPLWVLDCGSPLPLFCPAVSRLPRRQRAGALQDAAATSSLKFVCATFILFSTPAALAVGKF